MRRLGTVLVGVYAWTVTVAFGAVLVDIVYANQRLSAPGAAGEAADILLLLAGAAILAGLVAIAASWDRRAVVVPLVASVTVLVVTLVGAGMMSGVVEGAETDLGIRIGPWLRIGSSGLASIVAFIGLRESWRSQ